MVSEGIIFLGGILAFLLLWSYLPKAIGKLANAIGIVPNEENSLLKSEMDEFEKQRRKTEKDAAPDAHGYNQRHVDD